MNQLLCKKCRKYYFKADSGRDNCCFGCSPEAVAANARAARDGAAFNILGNLLPHPWGIVQAIIDAGTITAH
ncbi:MAG: hypothetical protein LBJ95_02335 [Oscillospiraceae bacterium]|nr:hypothetical protein [Oscillospiraceae bacterium]